jgi:hypothetical protein
MFEFSANIHPLDSERRETDVIELFLEKNRFTELYLLICTGIGLTFFNYAAEIKNRAGTSGESTPLDLIRQGELDALKDNIREIIEKAGDIFPFDLNEVYKSLKEEVKLEMSEP